MSIKHSGEFSSRQIASTRRLSQEYTQMSPSGRNARKLVARCLSKCLPCQNFVMDCFKALSRLEPKVSDSSSPSRSARVAPMPAEPIASNEIPTATETEGVATTDVYIEDEFAVVDEGYTTRRGYAEPLERYHESDTLRNVAIELIELSKAKGGKPVLDAVLDEVGDSAAELKKVITQLQESGKSYQNKFREWQTNRRRDLNLTGRVTTDQYNRHLSHTAYSKYLTDSNRSST